MANEIFWDTSGFFALLCQTGATRAIKVHLRDGKAAVRTLEAIYNNVYQDNAEMLGAWRTASHVERTNARTKPAEPAPVPVTGGGAPVPVPV
jgi:hypothetical protein